jgi:uncharacterized membrane protein YphA (DoxX/SURF4 family)
MTKQNMNLYLWIAQIVLSLTFLGSGLAKITMSQEKMAATGQTGAAVLPLGFVRFIALCEILGALGITLPVALGIGRFLTPLAAIGLAIIMIGAACVHLRLREPRAVAVNILLLILCGSVIYGRWY